MTKAMNPGVVAAVVWLIALGAFAQQYRPIDISRFIDKPLSSYKPNESWAAPPRGLQTLEGVLFEIDGKIEVAGLGAARDGRFYPTRAAGIPVGRKAARLHVLHAAGYADQDGTPIAKLVLNYADGQQHPMPLSYGVHSRNWYLERNEQTAAVTDTNTMIAWRGSCPDTDRMGVTLRLFKTLFPNPRPDEEIKRSISCRCSAGPHRSSSRSRPRPERASRFLQPSLMIRRIEENWRCGSIRRLRQW